MCGFEGLTKTFSEIRDWLKEVSEKVPYDHEEFKRRQKTEWVRLEDVEAVQKQLQEWLIKVKKWLIEREWQGISSEFREDFSELLTDLERVLGENKK